MSDAAFSQLLSHRAQNPGCALWFADESIAPRLPQLAPWAEGLLVISQRCDLVTQAQRLGINALLADAHWPEHTPAERVYLRIGKEKPWVHQVINLARQHLPVAGNLLLAGAKSEGIKTYADKAASLFNQAQKPIKEGDSYTLTLQQPAQPPTHWLDTQDYPRLRQVLTLDGKPVFSKPGIYGWDKVDLGSAFLMDTLSSLSERPLQRLLDLGCGYGYLTLRTANWQVQERWATDNNCLAIAALEATCNSWQLQVHLNVADCAAGLPGGFDLVLCNPPFHQGFEVESSLTTRFLAAASQQLRPDGSAYFVVNRFIPLEKKAQAFFRHCQEVAHNGKFTVLHCQQPKASGGLL
jgi:16S rRNA (guanine1207-N2)-methyltransferase